MIDIVTAVGGDVGGDRDNQDRLRQDRLVFVHVTQPDQRKRRDPLTERIADLPGRLRGHDVSLDAEIGHVADREAADPRYQIRQRGRQAILQSSHQTFQLVTSTALKLLRPPY